jgi:hypothetical protein
MSVIIAARAVMGCEEIMENPMKDIRKVFRNAIPIFWIIDTISNPICQTPNQAPEVPGLCVFL